jgi:hypothetical protein
MNTRLLAQMRAATRSLMRRGPSVAQTVMHESIENAKVLQSASQGSAARATQSMQAASAAAMTSAFDPFSDMLADLSRLGQFDGNPFNAPPLSSGAGARATRTTWARATTSCTFPAPMPTGPRRWRRCS